MCFIIPSSWSSTDYPRNDEVWRRGRFLTGVAGTPKPSYMVDPYPNVDDQSAGFVPSAYMLRTHAHGRFDRVPYRARVVASATLMMLSFITVGYGTETWIRLMGVAFSSMQGGLGEASCLALASLYDTPRALTAWSSGTGFAGIYGYAWVFFFRFVLGLSLRSTLQMAHFLAAGWLLTYFVLLGDPHSNSTGVGLTTGGNSHTDYSPLRSPSADSPSQTRVDETRSADRVVNSGGGLDRGQQYRSEKDDGKMATSTNDRPSLDVQQGDVESKSHSSVEMTTRERLQFTLSLWPYMVPLTLVYFAEVRRACSGLRNVLCTTATHCRGMLAHTRFISTCLRLSSVP